MSQDFQSLRMVAQAADFSHKWDDANADFVDTFDPPTVLSLLDEIERLREQARCVHYERTWEDGVVTCDGCGYDFGGDL